MRQRQHPVAATSAASSRASAGASLANLPFGQCLEEIVGPEHGVLDPHVDDGEMVRVHTNRGWVSRRADSAAGQSPASSA